MRLILILTVILMMAAPAAADDNQLLNLGPGEPDQPRFEIPDPQWPADHGQANVCLWEDGKIAAVSLSLDDNVVGSHDFWIEELGKRGWSMTWFVISDHVTSMPDYFGPWSAFRRLHANGHDIQSHSRTHGHCRPCPCPLEDEYGIPITDIEENVPGSKVLTFAYPGQSCYGHDQDLAAKYYIAARASGGHPDMVNRINYFWAKTGFVHVSWHEGSWLVDITTRKPGYEKYYRGWLNLFWHGTGVIEETLKDLDELKANEDKIWVTNFTNAVMYNIEWVTHALEVTDVGPSRISFTLTDRMLDAVYTYPLTVKVRIDNAWQGVKALQNGNPVQATLVRGPNGLNYAMVKAVPDGGQVVLSPADADPAPRMPGAFKMLQVK